MSVKQYKKNEHDLPIPRLQVRITPCKDGYNSRTVYSLIKYQVHGVEEVVISRSKFTKGFLSKETLPRPHNTFAHLLHDMWTMNLPAFLVNKTEFEEIKIANEVMTIPNGLWNRMSETPGRQEEFLLLRQRVEEIRADYVARGLLAQ